MRTDAENEQHDEEHHGEELRYEIDLRDCLRISHESQSDVAFSDVSDVDVHDMSEMAESPKHAEEEDLK
jgi:hypothetical protein